MNAGVPIATPAPVSCAAACRVVERPRDAEVEHLDAAVARDEEVRGLDVAVDDARRVRRGEHVEQLAADRDGHRARAARRPSGSSSWSTDVPVEQLHDEERRAVLGDVVVHDAHGARVLHRVGGVPLAQEPRAHARASGQLRVQHLDGELGLVAVRGLVDDGHPADRRGRRRGGTCRGVSVPRRARAWASSSSSSDITRPRPRRVPPSGRPLATDRPPVRPPGPTSAILRP